MFKGLGNSFVQSVLAGILLAGSVVTAHAERCQTEVYAQSTGLQVLPKIEHIALSRSGPFGAAGPFAENGPLANNAWNPAPWLKAIIDFFGLYNRQEPAAGPLSELGPLLELGALGGVAQSFFRATFGADAVNSVFGPYGPMGPLGPLGPLGPVGALHTKGLQQHQNGYYFEPATGRTVSEICLGEKQQRFAVFEKYPAAYAARLSQNNSLDTSFMVQDSVNTPGETREYNITSPRTQTVFIMAVPLEYVPLFSGLMPAHLSPANFVEPSQVYLRDSSGKPLAISRCQQSINYLRVNLQKGKVVRVGVRPMHKRGRFHLIVTGAGRVLSD